VRDRELDPHVLRRPARLVLDALDPDPRLLVEGDRSDGRRLVAGDVEGLAHRLDVPRGADARAVSSGRERRRGRDALAAVGAPGPAQRAAVGAQELEVGGHRVHREAVRVDGRDGDGAADGEAGDVGRGLARLDDDVGGGADPRAGRQGDGVLPRGILSAVNRPSLTLTLMRARSTRPL